MTTTPTVIRIITEQHATIRQLFDGVDNAAPEHRADAFEPLVRLLAVHETVEEEIVYPAIERLGDDAGRIAEARKAEEDAAKKALADLEGMDCASDEFAAAFAQFRGEVDAHATREESEVIPLLAGLEPDSLESLGTAFTVAEAMAPTHAHRLAPESAVGNMLLGPFVAMVDRVRDAIHDVAVNTRLREFVANERVGHAPHRRLHPFWGGYPGES
jgi:hypothetical protein